MHDATESYAALKDALDSLREEKPDERGELARRYAVTITDMEKIVAYFKTMVVDALPHLDH